jgi:hypothetical protein
MHEDRTRTLSSARRTDFMVGLRNKEELYVFGGGLRKDLLSDYLALQLPDEQSDFGHFPQHLLDSMLQGVPALLFFLEVRRKLEDMLLELRSRFFGNVEGE